MASLDDEALDTPLGEAAGYFAGATGRSFVLHIADELIHHTAEAALLRDLFGNPFRSESVWGPYVPRAGDKSARASLQRV